MPTVLPVRQSVCFSVLPEFKLAKNELADLLSKDAPDVYFCFTGSSLLAR
jgi:hypothetical protein